MDATLVQELIDRDWAQFVAQSRRLGLGAPERSSDRIDLVVSPTGTTDRFRAVLLCDGYDAVAPALDFAELETGVELGKPYWPRMSAAPYNEIAYAGRRLPILCTPGTRGYHLHPSHHAESHDKNIWRLPLQADLIARLLTRMGSYQGCGL
jgi:hypothetical protein